MIRKCRRVLRNASVISARARHGACCAPPAHRPAALRRTGARGLASAHPARRSAPGPRGPRANSRPRALRTESARAARRALERSLLRSAIRIRPSIKPSPPLNPPLQAHPPLDGAGQRKKRLRLHSWMNLMDANAGGLLEWAPLPPDLREAVRKGT